MGERREAERAFLQAVVDENVTWSAPGSRSISYRVWSTEHDYETCTPVAKRAVAAGHVKREMAAGYSYITRGFCALTPEGRARLAELNPPSEPVEATEEGPS